MSSKSCSKMSPQEKEKELMAFIKSRNLEGDDMLMPNFGNQTPVEPVVRVPLSDPLPPQPPAPKPKK